MSWNHSLPWFLSNVPIVWWILKSITHILPVAKQVVWDSHFCIILLFLLTMLLPLDSWRVFFFFFPLRIFSTSYAPCPVKSIFEQIIIFNYNFSLNTKPSSLSDIQIYLPSLCENFKMFSFLTHTLTIGVRQLRLKLWLPNIFPIIVS